MAALAQTCAVEPKAKPSAVLEALRRHKNGYVARYGIDPLRIHALHQLCACRTAKLGAHLCVCEGCGYQTPVYNSCRNRHCPQCQGAATADWLQARAERMLATPHFQVVFTLPAELRPVAATYPKVVHALMFRCAAGVLQDLAAQRLGARLGMTAVLHTWTNELTYHPHVHFLVTAGGLSLDGLRWVPSRKNFLFPRFIIGAMFRGRFLDALITALERAELAVDEAELDTLRRTVRKLSKRHPRFIVHVEAPQGRPHEAVLKYLARYIKRVAIGDERIIEVTDDHVSFRTRKGPRTLDGPDFVHRFLLHVLPKGFRKVRHYGLYAPGSAKALAKARPLLPATASRPEPSRFSPPACPACGEQRLRHVFPSRYPLAPLTVMAPPPPRGVPP